MRATQQRRTYARPPVLAVIALGLLAAAAGYLLNLRRDVVATAVCQGIPMVQGDTCRSRGRRGRGIVNTYDETLKNARDLLTAERLGLMLFAALSLVLAVVAVAVWFRTVRALRQFPVGPLIEDEGSGVRAWRGVRVMIQVVPTIGLGIWFGLLFHTGTDALWDKVSWGIWIATALGVGAMMLDGRARTGEYVCVDDDGVVILQHGRFARLGWDDVVVSPASDGTALLDRRDGGRRRSQIEISAVLADTIRRHQSDGPLPAVSPTSPAGKPAPVELYGR